MTKDPHSLLIRNGLTVTEESITPCDIYCEHGTIHSMGAHLTMTAGREIDARGLIVIPGGIDVHTHLDLPTAGIHVCDDFESGTRAALFGGTTTIIDFATQPKGAPLTAALSQWHAMARSKAMCDYGFHLAVTDFDGVRESDIATLIQQEGVTSFKAYMAYRDIMLNDSQLSKLIAMLKTHRGLLLVHAEVGATILQLTQQFQSQHKLSPRYHALSHPASCEIAAIDNITAIAAKNNAPIYIVHLSTREGLSHIEQARAKMGHVYAETCISHLLIDDTVYASEDPSVARYVLSPPFRPQNDIDGLWQGIRNNQIGIVATDHCPFTLAQKAMGQNDFAQIPNGVSAIEHRMDLLYHFGVGGGQFDLLKYSALTATNPAKIFGLYPQKGVLRVGADADIVLFDPHQQHTIATRQQHSRCDYNIYEGWQITGRCHTVILRGEVVIEAEQCLAKPGDGKFVARGLSSLV